MKLTRKDLKPHRRMYMTVKEMSERSSLSARTINNIEDVNKEVGFGSIFKYLAALIDVFKDNGKDPSLQYRFDEEHMSVLIDLMDKVENKGDTLKINLGDHE